MIEAVLFDWNNTLVHFDLGRRAARGGHRAGLAATSDQDVAAFTARYRELVLDGATPTDDYARRCCASSASTTPDAFIDAEHEVWRPAHAVLGSAQALLDSLRSRGIKTGLVANSWPDPARLLRADVEAFGLAERLDVIVFSEEVGVRKPDAGDLPARAAGSSASSRSRDVRRRPPRHGCARRGRRWA